MTGEMHYVERLKRNEESKAFAQHDREPWTRDEIEFLLSEFPDCKGKPDDEMALAELMGRTIEACRQRYYDTVAGRKPGGASLVKRETTTTTTTTTTETFRGLHDDDEDRWWDGSSAYYKGDS